jgi:hypothetical protein
MAISQKQLEANRRNAQHSTGPKTDAGKGASRFNAVTHGMLARHVVITAGDYKENEREFAELLAQLREQFKPVGTAEDLEIQEIARGYWRKIRAVRHEHGVIREKTVDMRIHEELSREHDFEFQVRSGSICGRNSRVTEYLIKKLEKVKEMTVQGKVAVDSQDILKNTFPGRFAHLGNANASPEERRQLIAEIDQTLGPLREAHEQDRHVESVNLESKISAAALPAPEVRANLLRYETSINRELDRTLARLERMQERRRATGGAPPTS